jgi:hypothetical protein
MYDLCVPALHVPVRYVGVVGGYVRGALFVGETKGASIRAQCACTHNYTHIRTCAHLSNLSAHPRPRTVALGAVVEISDPNVLLQPLCVREKGSTEWYADSRAEPITVAADDILRIMDTFPSQRPIPSLGGGIGYGAEGVDCWEMQVLCVRFSV